MGKLPAIAWTGMVLASLGLAGCKCCQSCSKDRCANGTCSAPASSGHTTTTLSQPMPQGLPASAPTSSGQPVSATKPGQVQSYKSMPQGMPAATNASGWNNATRAPQQMPVGQPIHQVSPASATEAVDEVDASEIDTTVRPMQPANPTYQTPPSLSEQMQQKGIAAPARPREGF